MIGEESGVAESRDREVPLGAKVIPIEISVWGGMSAWCIEQSHAGCSGIRWSHWMHSDACSASPESTGMQSPIVSSGMMKAENRQPYRISVVGLIGPLHVADID